MKKQNWLLPFLFCLMAIPSLAFAKKVKGDPFKRELDRAIATYKKGQFQVAAQEFHRIGYSKKHKKELRKTAKLYLGLSLLRLKLYQTSSFPLITSIKEATKKEQQVILKNLMLISDHLHDTTLLDYALNRIKLDDLTEVGRELYWLRLGQSLMRAGSYDLAAENLKKLLTYQPQHQEGLYTLGLVHLKQNKMPEAIEVYERLFEQHKKKRPSHFDRGFAAMSLARAHYQAKNFAFAADFFEEIPKDHALYRQSLKDLSWSYFRDEKFRSALSALQTLHTPFYNQFYDPESLVLRGIILHFVCQNEDAGKVIQNFQRNYGPTLASLYQLSLRTEQTDFFLDELKKAQVSLNGLQNSGELKYKGQIPFFVLRDALESSRIKSQLVYLNRIEEELSLVERGFSGKKGQNLKTYLRKILKNRIKNARVNLSKNLTQFLLVKQNELAQFSADIEVLEYEILAGKKEKAKRDYQKKYRGELLNEQSEKGRDFYISNGYRFWPFEGEYWRDELGTYQYLGVNACESK